MAHIDIADKVLQIVSEKSSVPKDRLGMSTTFVQDLSFDSLAKMDFIVTVEDTFQMTIPDEDAEKVKTVGDAVNYLKKRLSH